MARQTKPARNGRYTPPARTGKAILATGFGLLALAQAQAPAAGAAEASPTLRWKSAGAAEDGQLKGTVRLRADVTTEQPVDGWSLSVLTTAQEPIFGVVCHESFKRPRNTFDVDCRWDTTRYPDQRPSANAHYLVRLMTQQGSTVQPAGPDRQVSVTNPASAPTDVILSYDGPSRRATLTWTPNPEPDVAHYDVEEKIGKGPWTRIAEPTDPRFERVLSEPGDHRFRVAAERRNADGQADGPGSWGNPHSSSSEARVPADRDRPRGSEPAAGTGRSPARERRKADEGSRPAPDTTSSTDPAAASEPEPQPERNRTSSTASDPAARRERNSPPPTSGPAPAETGQRRRSAAAYHGPPPQDHSSVVFSPSSADALASLNHGPTPLSVLAGTKPLVVPGDRPRTPAAKAPTAAAQRAPAIEEPDPGFQETLPYPHTDDDTSVDSAAPIAATPPTPQAAHPTRTRRPSTRRRVAGTGLVLLAAGLLGTAVRPPSRRSRPHAIPSRQDRPGEGPVASAEPQSPLHEAQPDAAIENAPPDAPIESVLPAVPADQPVWLPRLEACIARLEALVAMEHDTNSSASVSAI